MNISSAVTICVLIAGANLLLAARRISLGASSAFAAAFAGMGLAWFLSPLIQEDNGAGGLKLFIPNLVASFALIALWCGFWLRAGKGVNWWFMGSLWGLWIIPLCTVILLGMPTAVHVPFAVASVLAGILSSAWCMHYKQGFKNAGDWVLVVWLVLTFLVSIAALVVGIENRHADPSAVWLFYLGFGPTLLTGIGLFSLLGFTLDAIHASNELARTDGLTGLLNRRAFDEELAISMARSQRYQRALSLISLDIDRFKDLNDAHGHPTGDAVLRAVAKVLLDKARRIDTVARIGGEEFAVLLADTTGPAAMLLAERLRQGIVDASVGNVGFSASAGVASVEDTGMRASDLVKAADQALYVAKKSGRNCVRYAEKPADKPDAVISSLP